MVLRILIILDAAVQYMLAVIQCYFGIPSFALVSPCKDQHMNSLDSLLLAGLVLINILSCTSEYKLVCAVSCISYYCNSQAIDLLFVCLFYKVCNCVFIPQGCEEKTTEHKIT